MGGGQAMSEPGLTRYDENYDEGGYRGIGMSADGRYYKATDIDLMRTQALELARDVMQCPWVARDTLLFKAAQRFREEFGNDCF